MVRVFKPGPDQSQMHAKQASNIDHRYKAQYIRLDMRFFNIINEPEADDAKALQNVIFEVNAEGKERISSIDGKLDQLRAKPVTSTQTTQSIDGETNVNLPVDNLRMQN